MPRRAASTLWHDLLGKECMQRSSEFRNSRFLLLQCDNRVCLFVQGIIMTPVLARLYLLASSHKLWASKGYSAWDHGNLRSIAVISWQLSRLRHRNI